MSLMWKFTVNETTDGSFEIQNVNDGKIELLE